MRIRAGYCGSIGWKIAAILISWIGSAQAAPRFSPPEIDAQMRSSVSALSAELEAGKFAEAAARIDQLQSEHADALVSADNAALVSISQAISTAIAGKQLQVTIEHDRKRLEGARAVLNAALNKPDAWPEDIYAVATRYPCSAVTGEALLAAAESSLGLGDVAAASDLGDLATSAGARLSQEQVKRFARCRQIDASNLSLPMVFDAAWYGTIHGFSVPRSFPIYSQEQAIVASERYVFSLSSSGVRTWTYSPVKPWMDQPREQQSVADTGRGSIYFPAVLCGARGEAQVIVVRQPQTQNVRGCLRALRAGDGKLIWTSEDDPSLAAMTIVSQPAVRGRFVYAVAVAQNVQTSVMQLIALETTTGRLIWSTPLGSLIGLDRLRDVVRIREAEDCWRQTAPLVTPDRVVVCPNVGWVFCVDRFSGSLRWAQSYPAQAFNVELAARLREGRSIGRFDQSPPASFIRYSHTPVIDQGTLVCGPYDSDSLFAMNLRDGTRIWQTPAPVVGTLIGAGGGRVVIAGAKVVALDIRTAQQAWECAPPSEITGPVIVFGNTVHLPQPGGITAISISDAAPAQPVLHDFRPIAKLGATKAALAGTGLSGVFDRPEPAAGK